MSTITDLALAVYYWATMNLGPEVYVVLVVVTILLIAMKYDDRKRAKRAAESRQSAPAE